MKILDHISRYRDLHIEGYAIFLLAISLRWFWMVLVWMIYLYMLRRRLKWKVLWFFSLLVIIQFTWITERDIPHKIHHEVYVVDVIHQVNYDTVVVLHKFMKFRFHTSSNQYREGDMIWIEGNITPYRKKTVFFGFDAKTYYLSQGIYGDIKSHQSSLVNRGFYIDYIKDLLYKRIEPLESKDYIKTFVFGEKALSIEERTTYQELGILFLFSVSGLHLYVLIQMIKKMMFHFNLSKHTQQIIILSVYGAFLYFYDGSMTILRIMLLYVMHWINDHYHFKFTHLDLIQCTFLLMLITNPFLIYNQGIFMLYIILNAIVLLNPIFKRHHPIMNRFKVSGVIQLLILPFRLTIHLSVFLWLPLILFFLSGPAFLLSLFTMIFPHVDAYYIWMMNSFFTWIHVLDHIGLNIFLKALNPLELLLYFVFLFGLFYVNRIKYKMIFILLMGLLFFHHVIIPFDQNTKIMMLDVSQGDTFYFESKTCNMMIDSFNGSKDFLVNRGIYELDYLFLTHPDYDHIKEATDIQRSIHVKETVISKYDTYPNMFGKLLLANQDDRLTCGPFEIHILGPIHAYSDSNNNSLVLQIKVYNKVMLFTGDIEKDAEDDLISTYGNKLKSDLLKVSHHGSKTSTSQAFLDIVKPNIALISAGYQNSFGFPNIEVLNRLNQQTIEIFRTDLDGTWVYTYDENKRKWLVHLPFKDDF